MCSAVKKRINNFKEQYNTHITTGPNIEVNRDINIGRML